VKCNITKLHIFQESEMKPRITIRKIEVKWNPMEGMSRRERITILLIGCSLLFLLFSIIVWAVLSAR
jgi:hypothetical protein